MAQVGGPVTLVGPEQSAPGRGCGGLAHRERSARPGAPVRAAAGRAFAIRVRAWSCRIPARTLQGMALGLAVELAARPARDRSGALRASLSGARPDRRRGRAAQARWSPSPGRSITELAGSQLLRQRVRGSTSGPRCCRGDRLGHRPAGLPPAPARVTSPSGAFNIAAELAAETTGCHEQLSCPSRWRRVPAGLTSADAAVSSRT